MGTLEEDYTRPLKEVYESLPEATRKTLSADIRKIWTYFIAWVVFIAISAVAIVWLVGCELIDESLGGKLQRAGSIVPVLAVIGETLFIVKLNKLASVIHPAQLTYEIYKQRRFKPLVYISYHCGLRFQLFASAQYFLVMVICYFKHGSITSRSSSRSKDTGRLLHATS